MGGLAVIATRSKPDFVELFRANVRKWAVCGLCNSLIINGFPFWEKFPFWECTDIECVTEV